MMEYSTVSTPVVEKPIGRVLKPMSTSDLNSSSQAHRRAANKDDCKGLIKRMSTEKKTQMTKNNSIARSNLNSTRTYSMLFPPGSMGLHLDPVAANDMGAKVKGYHFPTSYNGINCAIIKDKVKAGDVITLIDNVDVSLMSFKEVFNILVTKVKSNKLVTFQRIIDDSIKLDPDTSFADVDATDTIPVTKDIIATEPASVISTRTPVPHDITPLKSLFPVRFEELSHVLLSVGTHIASFGGSLGGTIGTNLERGMLSVGTNLEDKTVQILDKTSKHVPRYSQQDMDYVEAKMCAILQELSHTCILLGKAEDAVASVKQEQKQKQHDAMIVRDNTRSDGVALNQLRDTNEMLTNRIEKILHELASEQANRDAWMARAKAAEDESQNAWEKCFASTVSRDTESDSYKERLEEYERQVSSLQEALVTANSEAEEALQLCASEQENTQAELALMRQEQSNMRAETSSMLEHLSTDKLQLEQERDSLSIQLEVLRDVSGSDKASLEIERGRLNEAMATQQSKHMKQLLEKEEAFYRLQEEISCVKDDLLAAQTSTRGVQSDYARLEVDHKATLAELLSAKSAQIDLEAKHESLRSQLANVQGEHETRGKELHRLVEVEVMLQRSKSECENYYKKYENEHAHTSHLEESIQELRAQLSNAQSAAISTDTELTTLRREYDQLQMSSETATRLATDHVNRVRKRFENRERELLDAIATSDHDTVAAKSNVDNLKEVHLKDIAIREKREADLIEKVEQLQEANASISKSKDSSEAISSQQASHLQAEVSHLMQEVAGLKQHKLEQEATIMDLETTCTALRAEKNGMHVTLSKQLNNQVTQLKDELSTVSSDLQLKKLKLEETLARLSEVEERSSQQLSSVERNAKSKVEVLKADFEDQLRAQQSLYSELKEKLAMDYDSKILVMRADMQSDLAEQLSFMKKAGEEKFTEECNWMSRLQVKDRELLELQSKLDLLEASSISSARVAAEQIDRLRTRAENRESELLGVMKGQDASIGAQVSSLKQEILALSTELASKNRLHAEEIHRLNQEVNAAKESHLEDKQKLELSELSEKRMSVKVAEHERAISELQGHNSIITETFEEEMTKVKRISSKELFVLEEKVASLTSASDVERSQFLSSERELKSSCEEYLSQLSELQSAEKSQAVKYEKLLSRFKCQSEELDALRESMDKLSASSLEASETESRHSAQMEGLVSDHERLKALLIESTTNFSSLSEKYTNVVSGMTEEASNVADFYNSKLFVFREESKRLRLELKTLKDFYQETADNFAASMQEFSEMVRRKDSQHEAKVSHLEEKESSLEEKCKALLETLEHQQELIGSANEQQQTATQNRASMLSIIEDWRSKTSEAMHTILHMQHGERALKVAYGQEKESNQQLRKSVRDKETEVTQLWELVDRLADEVKKATNKNEHLVTSIDSWNSVHDTDPHAQLHIEPIIDSNPSSPETNLRVGLSDSLEIKEHMYSDISKRFPTSAESRSDRCKHLNIPKSLIDSLDSSSNSLFPVAMESVNESASVAMGGDAPRHDSLLESTGESPTTVAITRTSSVIDTEAVSMAMTMHVSHSSHSTGEDIDAERMSSDGHAGGEGKMYEDENSDRDEASHGYCHDFDDEDDGVGGVSGHVIGLHDYRLDETADWYLSSDTEDFTE